MRIDKLLRTIDMKMKPSFVRMRKRYRAVLVVPSHLSDLAPPASISGLRPSALSCSRWSPIRIDIRAVTNPLERWIPRKQ
jgi:hypothetical protein